MYQVKDEIASNFPGTTVSVNTKGKARPRAFEITNEKTGQVYWSKLQTGEFPDEGMIVKILKEAKF